jgi:hypothetical protein
MRRRDRPCTGRDHGQRRRSLYAWIVYVALRRHAGEVRARDQRRCPTSLVPHPRAFAVLRLMTNSNLVGRLDCARRRGKGTLTKFDQFTAGGHFLWKATQSVRVNICGYPVAW